MRAPRSRPAGRSQTQEQSALVLERDVDERVQADDRIAAGLGCVERSKVRTDEGRLGNEPPRSLDLDLRDVDTGHREAGVDEPPVGRHAHGASKIQDLRPAEELGGQLSEPAGTPRGPSTVASLGEPSPARYA